MDVRAKERKKENEMRSVARCSKKKKKINQKSNKLTILLSSVDALIKRKISKKEKKTEICINVFKELVRSCCLSQ